MVTIKQANSQLFPEVFELLTAEKQRGEAGFHCNWKVIQKSFSFGEGLCAFVAGKIVGFVVFNKRFDGSDIDIIQVAASSRGVGIGSQMLLSAVANLRKLGAPHIDVECTSMGGVVLCKKHGFLEYVDPNNYRSESDNPLLRLYLSDWRPSPPIPWA